MQSLWCVLKLSSHFCLTHTIQLLVCRTIMCKNLLDHYLFATFCAMVGLGAILHSNMMGTTVFPNMVQYFSIPQPRVVGCGAEIKFKHSGILHNNEEMIYSAPNAYVHSVFFIHIVFWLSRPINLNVPKSLTLYYAEHCIKRIVFVVFYCIDIHCISLPETSACVTLLKLTISSKP